MEITKQTLKCFPWGHQQYIVYGNKRIGKTIYLIKSMMEQYRLLYRLDKDQAFNEVMKRTYFTVREFIDDMKKLRDEKGYIPSCHIDDAGTGFSKHLWNKKGGRTLASELKDFIETCGTTIIGLYFSAPATSSILGFIQTYEGKIVHIISNANKKDKWRRIGKIYKWNVLPSGTTKIDTHIDEDPFSCYLDKQYFDIYWAIRETYASKNLDKLDEAEKQLNQIDASKKLTNDILNIIAERLAPSPI